MEKAHFPENTLEKAVFPESLGPKDRELIVERCVLQRKTQPDDLARYARAYNEVKHLASQPERIDALGREEYIDEIHRIAVIIYPLNKWGYRKDPERLYWSHHKNAVDPGLIEDAMVHLCEEIVGRRLLPDEAYVEFETIRPFQAGNSRLADLVWKLEASRVYGKWPLVLAPDVRIVKSGDIF